MDTLDWQKLAGVVSPSRDKVPYEPNKHLFRKVAFDVFQLKGGPVEAIWVLEENDNGESYLVAQYDEDATKGLEAKSSWAALADRDGSNVTLLYNNTPIQRFASAEFGFTKDDVHLFQEALVEKLASDESFKAKFLQSLPQERRDALLSQFPELA